MNKEVTSSLYQVLPPLTAEEYEALKADIAEHGVLVPIELDEQGNVLDGYHRVRACEELGITGYLRFVRDGLSEEEKRAHARRLNLVRRHLNQEQKRELIPEQLKETPEKSDNLLATLLGVTDKTVRSVRDELEATSEIPKLEKLIGADGKSRPAYQRAVIVKSPSEARRAVEALATLPREALPGRLMDVKLLERFARKHEAEQRARTVTGDVSESKVKLLLGDMRERSTEIADASVDLIFTDPPYGEEFLPLWSELSRLAARVLKPSRLLIAYTGQVFLPEVMKRLQEDLRYWWSGVIVLPGQHLRIVSKNIENCSKPLLFFSCGDFSPPEWILDTIASEARQKELHDWQQSPGVARYYIEKLTQPSATILDPFLGSGTTAVAAVELGRRFIGIECDPAAFAAARERLDGITQEDGA